MSYKISARADRDLREIYGFGAGRFGDDLAERYHMDLERSFDLLERHPMLAREQPFLPPVRIHTYRSHAILYRIEGDDFLIVRVLRANRDWRRHL